MSSIGADPLPSFPWYRRVTDGSLQQGDIFLGCRVFVPAVTDAHANAALDAEVPVDVRIHDVVVLSQSCDLEQKKLESVLLAPHWPLSSLDGAELRLPNVTEREKARRGLRPGIHMLAAWEVGSFKSDVRVVSFAQVFSMPFTYVAALAASPAPRLRLQPPYREHLAQAFARFIMRVGLPVDIPPFK